MDNIDKFICFNCSVLEESRKNLVEDWAEACVERDQLKLENEWLKKSLQAQKDIWCDKLVKVFNAQMETLEEMGWLREGITFKKDDND